MYTNYTEPTLRVLATADEAAIEGVVTLGRMTCRALVSILGQQTPCRYSAVQPLDSNVQEVRTRLASSRECLQGS